MPYKSKKQERYIRAKAGEGEKWAKDFVKHSSGKKRKKKGGKKVG